MEQEKNILEMVHYILKGNIYIIREGEEKNIIKVIKLNLKENFYLIKNGQEKDIIIMEILYMN